MKIISVCNQKGGCAKTTTTINLAASLVNEGKKVLIIDNDYQANLTMSIGIKPGKHSLLNCFTENIDINKLIVPVSTVEHLYIIPSNLDYSNADHILLNAKNNKFLFKKIFSKLEQKYDYILIDCAPSLNLTVINALVASDSILVPLEPSIFNLQGLGHLVQIINLIKSGLNPKLEIEGILLTRVDVRSKVSAEFRAEIEKIFPNKILETEIHLNTAINRSQSCGLPVSIYEPSSKGAMQYNQLAKEILNNE